MIKLNEEVALHYAVTDQVQSGVFITKAPNRRKVDLKKIGLKEAKRLAGEGYLVEKPKPEPKQEKSKKE